MDLVLFLTMFYDFSDSQYFHAEDYLWDSRPRTSQCREFIWKYIFGSYKSFHFNINTLSTMSCKPDRNTDVVGSGCSTSYRQNY